MIFTKQEGFAGQSSVTLPQRTRRQLRGHPLFSGLYLTDIGYYPHASFHYRERKNGADEHILIYVISGAGVVCIGGDEVSLQADQFVVIPSGMSHWYRADEESPWSIYWLHFVGKGDKGWIFNHMHSQVIDLPPSSTPKGEARLRLFDEMIQTLSMGFSEDTLAYVHLCLPRLLATFRYYEQFHRIINPQEGDLIQRAINHMRQHLDRPLTLEDLAVELDISTSHFARLFKDRTRHSPIEYFIHQKIQYACQLLNGSSMRVHEVGRAVGYEDAYYFSRIFKKVMGVSPMQYKRQHHG